MAEFSLSPERLWSAFRSLRLPVQAAVALAIVLAVVLLANLLSGGFSRPVYAPLFSHLSDRDGGNVLQALDKLNVPYKVENDTILVPAEQVDATRYRLAAQGLPKADNGGFDALQGPALGMTSLQEQMVYQHALEAELSHTLQNIAPVATARVHLAIPKPTPFLRNGPQPSAAVLIDTKPGTNLDEEQVQAIRQIVANGVPGMSVSQVGIVNQQGELLARAEDAERQKMSPDERDAAAATETEMASRAVDALAPWLGKDNIRVQVAAQLNFTERETTYERSHTSFQGSSRTVKTVREPSGSIERLSTLVVVNETSLPESERNAPGTQEKIRQLVSQALGMENRRRDSLQVVMLPFDKAPARIPQMPVPSSGAADTADAGQYPVLPVLALGALVLTALGFLGWLFRSRKPARPAAQEVQQESLSPFEAAVNAARTSVLDDPARAASVIRLWIQS
jgi:flagellar biosynthesis/type III secretory pathway M-ring protein FliF/YscJ